MTGIFGKEVSEYRRKIRSVRLRACSKLLWPLNNWLIPKSHAIDSMLATCWHQEKLSRSFLTPLESTCSVEISSCLIPAHNLHTVSHLFCLSAWFSLHYCFSSTHLVHVSWKSMSCSRSPIPSLISPNPAKPFSHSHSERNKAAPNTHVKVFVWTCFQPNWSWKYVRMIAGS